MDSARAASTTPSPALPSDTPPDDQEILAGITAVAREQLDYHGDLTVGMRLIEDLELDSLRLLTLAVEVENHFRVCLDEEDDRAIETVGDLVAVVRRELVAEADAAGGAEGGADGGAGAGTDAGAGTSAGAGAGAGAAAGGGAATAADAAGEPPVSSPGRR